VEVTPGSAASTCGGVGGAVGSDTVVSDDAGGADGGAGSTALAAGLASFSCAAGGSGGGSGPESATTRTAGSHFFATNGTMGVFEGTLDDDDDEVEEEEDVARLTFFLRVHVPSRTMPWSVAHFLNAEELKRFLTPFSVRPSKPLAIAAHLFPWSRCSSKSCRFSGSDLM